ncbi:MAG TPA: beta-ketoacyl synthase [Amycolatopsis sp.]|nr:beta-ketoacyl synthase [Amycolatopsis sp.]
MTAQLDALDFDGEPFDALLWSLPADPAPAATTAATDRLPAVRPAPRPEPVAQPQPARDPGADPVARLIQDVRAELVSTHLSAMAVQEALQRQALAALGHRSPATPTAGTAAPAPVAAIAAPAATGGTAHDVTVGYSAGGGVTVSAAQREPGPSRLPVPPPASSMSAFKALALTPVTALDGAALAALVRGEIAAVFGSAYDQEGVNPALRLTECGTGTLTEVHEITRHAGSWRRGRLRATGRIGGTDTVAGAVELVWQAAQVFAFQVGLHLCMAESHFHAGEVSEVDFELPAAGPVEIVADVVQIDLIPRPWLRVDAELRRDGAVVGHVRGVTLEIREADGLAIGPEHGGVIPRFFGRRSKFGRALLGEFHMTHSARGELSVALGPEFARCSGRRATRMPNGGLQLCDRVMSVDGERGKLTETVGHTEYDSPADSWYYAESANASMPNVVYMETSLQSALLLGYFLGATLTAPEEDYCLRNLDGTARVLREVDLRDKTIQQTSTLLTTTVMVGAVLQSFSYELSVDGEPFYAGESLFGFFNETALANQNGLDNGAYVPPWLESQSARPAVRVIDVAARRASGTGVRAATGHMSLVDSIEVVDGGGSFGQGYLRAVRPVTEDDWFFTYHFHLDPVMPGSLGVEAVIQAIQEWAVDAGLGADLKDPEFVLPAGLPMSWRYRGQILAGDGEMTLEVHIKSVERRPGRVRIVGDASVWKPGMRIYELTDIAAELRGAGAEPW